MRDNNENIIKRIKAPTPKFFKKVILTGITMGAAGGALIAIPDTIILPDIIDKIAGYMIAIGAVSAAVAKTTKDESKNSKNNNK